MSALRWMRREALSDAGRLRMGYRAKPTPRGTVEAGLLDYRTRREWMLHQKYPERAAVVDAVVVVCHRLLGLPLERCCTKCRRACPCHCPGGWPS